MFSHWAYSRDGNYKQRYLNDIGLPGAKLWGSLRTIFVKGRRGKGFGEEQTEYWAQVGLVGHGPLLHTGTRFCIDPFWGLEPGTTC